MAEARAAPYRMNVSHTSPDATIQQVLDKIDGEALVTDALGNDGVEGVIRALFEREPRPGAFSLDLIAHSRRGILHLGEWAVDGNGKSKLLHHACADKLAKLNLREIRLLGCNTAISFVGQQAICSLHQIFGVPVHGTRVPISARDFDAYGFIAEKVLCDQDHLPRATRPTFQAVGAWFNRFEKVAGQTIEKIIKRLRRESLSDVIRDWSRTRPHLRWPIRQLDRLDLEVLLEHVEPELANVPGLLALPDLELVIPVEDDFGGPRYHRFTVLLDGLWIRIYPRDRPEGLVLRTHGDEHVQEALCRGVELLRA